MQRVTCERPQRRQLEHLIIEKERQQPKGDKNNVWAQDKTVNDTLCEDVPEAGVANGLPNGTQQQVSDRNTEHSLDAHTFYMWFYKQINGSSWP